MVKITVLKTQWDDIACQIGDTVVFMSQETAASRFGTSSPEPGEYDVRTCEHCGLRFYTRNDDHVCPRCNVYYDAIADAHRAKQEAMI